MHQGPLVPQPDTLARRHWANPQQLGDRLSNLLSQKSPQTPHEDEEQEGRFNNVESENTDMERPVGRKSRGQTGRAQRHGRLTSGLSRPVNKNSWHDKPTLREEENGSSSDEFHTPPSSPLQTSQPEFEFTVTSKLCASRGGPARRPRRTSPRKPERSRASTKEPVLSTGSSFTSTVGSSSASSSFTEAQYPSLNGSFHSQSTAPTSVNSSFSAHSPVSGSKDFDDSHYYRDLAGDLSTVQEASNSGNTTAAERQSDPYEYYEVSECTDEDEPVLIQKPSQSNILPEQTQESEDRRAYAYAYDADASEYVESSDLETVATSFDIALSTLPPINSRLAHKPFKTLPYHVQYEAIRVALSLGVSASSCDDIVSVVIGSFYEEIKNIQHHYQDLWKLFKRFARDLASHISLRTEKTEMPQPTSETVWRTIASPRGWSDSLHLSGTACFVSSSSKVDFTIRLNPLSLSQGCRLFHRFGSDRFLVLRLPSPWDKDQRSNELKNLSGEKVLEGMVDWLVNHQLYLVNRKWRCFFIKEAKGRKKSNVPGDRSLRNEYYQQAFFFAEKGVGIQESSSVQDDLGFRGIEKKLRQELTREQLLRWHLPLDDEGVKNQNLGKVWSRISLALSTSTPTVCFEPDQIVEVPDKCSSIDWRNVMDDGCCVCSPAVLRKVGELLGLEETPTAVQGRLGGAKGIWMADPRGDWLSDEIYIHVNQSQLKYAQHELDKDVATSDFARMTLDVLAYSKAPSPAAINLQFLPILANRGVPFEVFKEVLEEYFVDALDDARRGLDDPILLRRWVSDKGGLLSDRVATKEVAWSAGVPTNQKECVILLLDAGFLPRTCSFIMDRVWQFLVQYCEDLMASLHITLKRSTHLFCVADPTDTLEEGQVSLYFSDGPLDPETRRRIDCLDQDILVARNPAHLPSDIQKVRAVSTTNPELRNLKDVIVFSTKGSESLASLLSGGDYDGDKPWVCWDPRLVQPFRNSKSKFTSWEPKNYFTVSQIKLRDLDLQHPEGFARFFREGFTASMEENPLGRVTTLFEQYCYTKGLISDRNAVFLAKLCSTLVDAQKQGMRLKQTTADYLSTIYKGKHGRLLAPAYKGQVAPKGDPAKWNLLDRLKFEVARERVEELKTSLARDVKNADKSDRDLTELFRTERSKAEAKPNSPLYRVLMKDLLPRLYAVGDAWGREFPASRRTSMFDIDPTPAQTVSFNTKLMRVYAMYVEIYPLETELSDPVIRRWNETADEPYSAWRLLKASALFLRYGHQGMAFPWYMAARELCYIKAIAVSKRLRQTPRVLVQSMYVPLKEHKKFLVKETTYDDDD